MGNLSYDARFKFMRLGPTYIDTRSEEQIEGDIEESARPHGFTEWMARRVAALRTRNAEGFELAELSMMSDHDLEDLGISRSAVGRRLDASVELELWAHG